MFGTVERHAHPHPHPNRNRDRYRDRNPSVRLNQWWFPGAPHPSTAKTKGVPIDLQYFVRPKLAHRRPVISTKGRNLVFPKSHALEISRPVISTNGRNPVLSQVIFQRFLATLEMTSSRSVPAGQRIKNIVAHQQRNNVRHHTGGNGCRSCAVKTEKRVHNPADTDKGQPLQKIVFESVLIHLLRSRRNAVLWTLIGSSMAAMNGSGLA